VGVTVHDTSILRDRSIEGRLHTHQALLAMSLFLKLAETVVWVPYAVLADVIAVPIRGLALLEWSGFLRYVAAVATDISLVDFCVSPSPMHPTRTAIAQHHIVR
jgi:hypothetical protein